MTAPVVSLQTIHDAVAAAFNGTPLSDGSSLFFTNSISNLEAISKERLPAALALSGRLTCEEYSATTVKNNLDIPIKLKVSAGNGKKASQVMRMVINDLQDQTYRVKGLPVDIDTGVVQVFSDKTGQLEDESRLLYLSDISGPTLTNANMFDSADSPFSTANLTINCVYFTDHDPEGNRPLLKIVDLNILNPADVVTDTGDDEMIIVGITTNGSPALPTFPIFYGIAIPATINAAFITALPSTGSASAFANTLSFGAGLSTHKLYYAFPSALGAPSRFIDTISGFECPFDLAATGISVTFGVNTYIYNVYASSNYLNAAVTIQVS